MIVGHYDTFPMMHSLHVVSSFQPIGATMRKNYCIIKYCSTIQKLSSYALHVKLIS